MILPALGLAGATLLAVRLAGTRHEPSRFAGPADSPQEDRPRPATIARNEGPDPADLVLPLAGLRLSAVFDTFDQRRAAGKHEAADIMAPRGSPVFAMTSGPVKKLFTSKPGGLTVYQFDRDELYCYYYAHLDGYAAGLKEGMVLRRGDVLGYVGSTGNAHPSNPHLHLAIYRLGESKRWWQGTPINPYPILKTIVLRKR